MATTAGEIGRIGQMIFRLFLDGKNRNQIAVYLTQAQIPTPTFYMKERGRGTCKTGRSMRPTAISGTKPP